MAELGLIKNGAPVPFVVIESMMAVLGLNKNGAPEPAVIEEHEKSDGRAGP